MTTKTGFDPLLIGGAEYRTFERHPFSARFPTMGKAELDRLTASIAENGQMEPIRVYEGKIIDGWNRYLACKALGLPMHFRYVNIPKREEVESRIISYNLHRRHLTAAQQAEWLEQLAADATLSTREVAEQTGVHQSTVVRRRAAQTAESDANASDSAPVNAVAAKRQRIVDALTEDPTRSDRAIAKLVAASDKTVGAVRADLGLPKADGKASTPRKAPTQPKAPKAPTPPKPAADPVVDGCAAFLAWVDGQDFARVQAAFRTAGYIIKHA